ncbi:conserved membrane hypothetical protein [Tenacibaculum sp. 190524A02b]
MNLIGYFLAFFFFMIKKIISLHHWLGTFFSALFLIWFLSGFVMMYHTFPFLSKNQQRALLPSQEIDSVLTPKEVFKNNITDAIYSLTLNFQLQKPVLHLVTTSGKLVSKYADTGTPITMSKVKALAIAKENVKSNASAQVTTITELDQWIPRTRFLKHMPIYKITFDNSDKTYTYISSVTGEVLATNTISERFWSWLGAIPHWIYFKDIRIHNTLWFQLIVWLSSLGFVMVITGIVTGIVRYQKKPNAKFKRFKNKWYNYHYYFGLFFGTFVCTWIFSGWMSMTPFSWTPSTSLNKNELQQWQQGSFQLSDISSEVWNHFLNQTKHTSIQESNFTLFNNQVFAVVYNTDNSQLYNLTAPKKLPNTEDYASTIQSFNIENSITGTMLLNTYDNYYYSRHNSKELPVIKVNTANKTSYYINPKTTKVLYKCATKNRIQRWIYHGLHSLDFSFLAWNRPLWDIVLFILLIGGTILSFTGTVLGYRFIKRKWKKKKHQKKKKLTIKAL